MENSLFGQGYFTIQDEASQLIAHLVNPQEGETIIDACCGPGGKLSHIYELGQEKITLIGVEKNKDQMDKAKHTMARLGHEAVEFVADDFLKYKPAIPPNKILLDAPCSGLGVLRRHPEGKWLKTEAIIKDMAIQQKKFIEKALDILPQKGMLIYSVCSFELEETIEQQKWIQKKFGDSVEIVSPVALLPDFYKRYVTRENILLLFSGNQNEADGFGAFIVRKV
ncbi:MAG: RsmB/NOP family class I SAM-dependent RNA methyltransferase [Bdellovibrionota bacterium]